MLHLRNLERGTGLRRLESVNFDPLNPNFTFPNPLRSSRGSHIVIDDARGRLMQAAKARMGQIRKSSAPHRSVEQVLRPNSTLSTLGPFCWHGKALKPRNEGTKSVWGQIDQIQGRVPFIRWPRGIQDCEICTQRVKIDRFQSSQTGSPL